MSEILTLQVSPISGLSSTNNTVQQASDPNTPETTTALATRVETCDAASGLSAIHEAGTGLVIWRRAVPFCLQSWLNQLDAACLPNLHVLVRPNDLRCAIEPELDNCEMPPCNMRDMLICDIAAHVLAFSNVIQTDLVDVRLERVSHDACWKFHRDCVEARFLRTYRGPGTEWVLPIYADRALSDQTSFNGPVEHIDLQEGVLFKGNSAGPGIGIVHRSPPIVGTGQTRMLLCLNQPSVTSPPPY